jgi:hypothetical protein
VLSLELSNSYRIMSLKSAKIEMLLRPVEKNEEDRYSYETDEFEYLPRFNEIPQHLTFTSVKLVMLYL